MDERVNRSNYVGFGDKNDRNRCDVRMGRGEERWRYEGTHGTFET